MVNKSSTIYNEARNNLRIKESRHIQWRVNDGDIQGQGVIRNISTTGMLLETNSNFIPTDGCRFSFDTSLGHDNFIPQNGKLVWHKKKPFSKNKYLCGVRFVEPGEYVLTKLRGRVQKGIKTIAISRRLRRIINTCLIVIMIAMTVFISWEASLIYRDISATNERLLRLTQQQALLTQSYVSRLEATQLELASVSEELTATRTLFSESQGILGEVRVDLELTKAVLADTEAYLERTKADLRRSQTESATLRSDMADIEVRLSNAESAAQAAAALAQEKVTYAEQVIAQAKQSASTPKQIPVIPVNDADKDKMTARIAQIEKERAGEKSEFENTIALLEEKNRQMTQQLQRLQGEIFAFGADKITTTEEGQKLLQRYQTEVALIKDKLNHFRHEAEQIRVDAMVERDRIRMEIGNNGYLVRDGKAVNVDIEKYRTAGLEESKEAADISTTAKASTEAPTAVVEGRPNPVAPIAVESATTRSSQAQAKPAKRQVQVDVTFVE